MWNVEVYEGLNELPEILIKPNNLTGNLKEDTENAKAVSLDLPEMSAAQINDYDYDFRSDSQTKVHNAAMGTQTVGALNVLGILVGVVSAILPQKKDKKAEVPREPVDRMLRGMYDAQYFRVVLDLESEEINDFISFAQENGLSHRLVKKEREMELLEFLLEQRRNYDPGTE